MASRDRFSGSYGSYRAPYSGGGGAATGGYRDDRRGPPKSGSRPGRKRSRSPGGRRGDSNRRGNETRVSGGGYGSRYEVQISTYDFKAKDVAVTDLKKRFPKMYVPSDFFTCDLRWMDCFLPNKPFEMGATCNFNVFHKDVEQPESLSGYDDSSVLEPSDADYSYSAKVMLLASTDLASLYQHTIRVADEEMAATAEKLHWMRQFHFLVGTKGKNEVMAIGGPWSPSLDGDDPSKNPQTLINTAIRTCRAQTGVDLSCCTRWHKFLELHYFRPAERVHSSKSEQVDGEQVQASDQSPEPRVETVVIFFPDVHNCMPSPAEWSSQRHTYKELLEKKLSSAAPATAADPSAADGEDNAPKPTDSEAASTQKPDDESSLIHYSKLDVSVMKVAELREQLDARKLDSKGLKSQLVSKLEAALKDEERKDKAESSTKNDVAKETEGDAANVPELSDKDIRRLERLYRLDEDRPCILVHPSRSARGGKFDCEKLSLSTLLDYRLDDQKEHTFEVSLFAEQFRDMIIRDSSFNIYRALVNAPEPPTTKENDGDETKNDPEEPDSKRRRAISIERKQDPSVRTVKRTVDPNLLFAFTVFDTGHAGYLKEDDMENIIFSLSMNLSRAQVRKLVQKISSRKPVVNYRMLTDKDVVEGDEMDVLHIRTPRELPNIDFFMGNKAFFEESAEIKFHIVGGKSNTLVEKLEKSETNKYLAELSVGEISAELGRTEKLLKDTCEAEERCRRDIVRLSEDLKEDQQRLTEIRSSNEIYYNLLKSAYDNLVETSRDIQRQFDEEKAAREAEAEAKRLAEEEKKKAEEALKAANEPEENNGEQMDTDGKDAGDKAEDFTVLDSA